MISHLLFISMTEILFIAFVAFLLFGTKKLPEVAKGIGKGYREFQRATDQIKEEIGKVTDDIKKEVEEQESKSKERDQESQSSTKS